MSGERLVNKAKINTEINRSEGKYTIIYDIHDGKSGYEVPDEFDGAFLEAGGIKFVDPVALETRLNGEIGDYEKILSKAKDREVPVYFGDLSLTEGVEMASIFGIGVEGSLGLGTVFISLFGKEISRRKFIKGVGLLAGGWLLFPMISRLADYMPGDSEQVRAIQTGVNKISEVTHPELFKYLLTFRHMVAGYKQEWLMREIGGKPHMVNIWGGMHTGYEDVIKMTLAEKKHWIERQIDSVGARQAIELESVYTVAKCGASSGKWQVEEMIEVQELKDLVM